MKRKPTLRSIGIYFFFFFLISSNSLLAQKDSTNKTLEFAEENNACFKCHGQTYYYYQNDWTERVVKERMNPYFIIDSTLFYESNHWNFKCIDCHSEDYSSFPHDGELRMEPKYECMDCHGGDEHYAKFNFETIEEEFHSSVHSSLHTDEFSCWMCHNPHTYKISARTNGSVKNFISYDNEICLSCHADISKYQLLTTHENPNIIEKHDWLPNQRLHFRNVRCIECHTEISSDILIAHNVRSKEFAVKNCVECHSRNSLLTATLYKYQFTEVSSAGFSNAAILKESYVIGANRNYILNYASLAIFGIVFGLILIHILLRIIIKH